MTKWAFNAAFERVCLSAWLRRNYPQHFSSYSIAGDTVDAYLNPASWKCTMIWAAYNGLPLSLEKAGVALGFEEQKLKEGRELIRYFCTPCKPQKQTADGRGTCRSMRRRSGNCLRNTMSGMCRWKCRYKNVSMATPVPDSVWEEYHLDQKINDRGICIDRDMVSQAICMDGLSKASLMETMQKKTGLENPTP